MRRSAMVWLMVLAGCGSGGTGDEPGTVAQEQQRTERIAVLIGFRSGIDLGAVQRAGGAVHSEWRELNAVGAHLPAAAIEALSHNPNVEYIEADRPVRALALYNNNGEETWGNQAIGADAVRGLGVTGSGVTVCVIDTGIDPSHPEFSGANYTGGYDYVDNDSDPTDKTGTTWGTGHGTHVSGTVFAQLNNVGMAGVATGVELKAYRVLDLTGVGSTTSVINALNDCKALSGKRIASLSLGSSARSRTEEKAFAAAEAAGVLNIAAAGNDGNKRTSYPAGYASVVSVAAVDANLAHASFSQVNKDVEISAPGVAVFSTVPVGQGLSTTATVAGTTYPSNSVEFSGKGTVTATIVACGLCDSTSSCGSVSGTFVALCDRGTNTFADKVTKATAQGAGAVIIANNDTTAPDDAGSFTLGAAGTWVPTVSVSYNSGVAIKGSLGSSATVDVSSSNYASWDGTSMATPHVSACAALAWSAKSSLTNAQVRGLLAATAKDLGAAGRDTSFGYGLVDCYKAVTSP